jgi:quercetin dioxygenase-like cupin family protein
MKSIRMLAVIAFLAVMAMTALAQDKPGIVSAATTKFGPLEGLPACLTLSPQRGDPTKGPAVILIKMTTGCKVPWHWHTANEGLMIVSGKGKLEMKGAAAAAMAPGDYAFLPGKHQHEFTCTAACTFFDVTEGVFDIHYVDKDGNEIPPAQALKASHAKPAATKAPAKTDKK